MTAALINPVPAKSARVTVAAGGTAGRGDYHAVVDTTTVTGDSEIAGGETFAQRREHVPCGDRRAAHADDWDKTGAGGVAPLLGASLPWPRVLWAGRFGSECDRDDEAVPAAGVRPSGASRGFFPTG